MLGDMASPVLDQPVEQVKMKLEEVVDIFLSILIN